MNDNSILSIPLVLAIRLTKTYCALIVHPQCVIDCIRYHGVHKDEKDTFSAHSDLSSKGYKICKNNHEARQFRKNGNSTRFYFPGLQNHCRW